jgi:hypothetical protein
MKLGNPLKRIAKIFGRKPETAAPVQRFENVPVPADAPRKIRRTFTPPSGAFGQSAGQKADRKKGLIA